jgi:hypothetical protein
MRKLQSPDETLTRKGEEKNPFPKKDALIDRRYDMLRSQLACVEGQLRESFRKRERLEEFSACSEAQEQHGGVGDWIKYQSAVQTKQTILSELKPEAFSVGVGLLAKSMLGITAAAAVALLPMAAYSQAQITPAFLLIGIGCMALVAAVHTKRKIQDGTPDIVEQLSLRVEEQIVDLERERKALTKRIFGMNPRKDE